MKHWFPHTLQQHITLINIHDNNTVKKNNSVIEKENVGQHLNTVISHILPEFPRNPLTGITTIIKINITNFITVSIFPYHWILNFSRNITKWLPQHSIIMITTPYIA